MKNVAIFALSLLVAASFARAEGEMHAVRRPGPWHHVNNRAHVGIPSVAVSQKNGRMWATWYAGVTPGEDSNNYAVLATSADNGHTWKEVFVADPDGLGPRRAFDPEVWIAPDGLLRWTWTERAAPLQAQSDRAYAGADADPRADALMIGRVELCPFSPVVAERVKRFVRQDAVPPEHTLPSPRLRCPCTLRPEVLRGTQATAPRRGA